MSVQTARIRHRTSVGALLAALAGVLAFFACSDGVAPDPAVLTVQLQVPKDTLSVGETIQITGSVVDGDGVLVPSTILWQNETPRIGAVGSNGVVTALAEGELAITATLAQPLHAEVVPASAVLTVRRAVASVDVAPILPATLFVGEVIQLSAQPRCAEGTPLDRAVTWNSSDPAVAAVSATGEVSGLSAGVATLTAHSEGRSGVVHVTVVPHVAAISINPPELLLRRGAQLQLAAILTDESNAALDGRTVSWSSSDPGTASVTPEGLVSGVAEGVATITASSEGRSGSTTVTVRAQAGSVAIEPVSAVLTEGGQVTLAATARDPDGAVIDRPVTWASQDPAIATVTAEGTVHAVSAGIAIITATQEGVTGSAVIVVQAPVAGVRVSPVAWLLGPGETVQLTAVLVDASGSMLQRKVTWLSGDPAIATVSAAGVVTGVDEGTIAITATSEGVSGTASITVQRPVATVSVTPSAASVDVDGIVQLTATPLDAAGAPLTRAVTWASSQPGVANVDVDGLVVGVSPGTATIVATAAEGTGAATITVRMGVENVVVSSLYTTVGVGATLPLSVTLTGQGGGAVQAQVDWSSDDEAVATVSSAGVVTGVSPGAVAINAHSDGKHGALTITVAAPVANITLSRPVGEDDDAPVMVGGTKQISVALYDAAGNALTDRLVAWSSSDPSVATVDATGLVLGVSQGTVDISASSEGATASLPLRVAGSGSGGGGGGGGDEGPGNNLSNPLVFAEGIGMTGLPVTQDPGLRPDSSEGITVTGNPFWYSGNTPDCGPNPGIPIYYCQQGTNTWRAEWVDGSLGAPRSARVTWGDNLTHHQFDTHTPLRIEVVLYDQGGDLSGFAMPYQTGTGPTEVQGTDGQMLLLPPTVFSVTPRLIIQKLENYDVATGAGDVVATIYDGSISEAIGVEGPGNFSAEVNVGGKVIFGFTLLIKDVVMPDPSLHKYGWWRIVFQLDDQADVGGVLYDRNLSLDVLDATTGLLYTPVLDAAAQRTWLDINVVSASGGGGGGGSHTP